MKGTINLTKIKKKGRAMRILMLSFVVLILLNLAGWSIYLAIHESATVALAHFGIVDYIIVNILIAAMCILIAMLISGKPLKKTVKEVID